MSTEEKEVQHTTEPWGHIEGRILSPMTDDPTTANLITDCGWEPQGLADARRIVAAVNACRGIATEELEAVNVGERPILVTVKDRHEELTAHHSAIRERDEARAMVRELALTLKKHEWSDSVGYDDEMHIFCPECGNTARRGHADGCELEATLKKAEALS